MISKYTKVINMVKIQLLAKNFTFMPPSFMKFSSIFTLMERLGIISFLKLKTELIIQPLNYKYRLGFFDIKFFNYKRQSLSIKFKYLSRLMNKNPAIIFLLSSDRGVLTNKYILGNKSGGILINLFY